MVRVKKGNQHLGPGSADDRMRARVGGVWGGIAWIAPFQNRPVSALSEVAVVLPAIPRSFIWSKASLYLSPVNLGGRPDEIGSRSPRQKVSRETSA